MPIRVETDAEGTSSVSAVSEEQPKQAQDRAREVLGRYFEAKKFRATFDKDWERWYRYYSGHQWHGHRPAWRSTPVVNFCFSTIETILPIMTDAAPQINVVAAKPDSADLAEVHGQIVKKIWVDQDMDLKLPETLKNTLKYGTGFLKVWWDPNASDGLGDVSISVVDPRHVFPSPGAKDIQDAEYLIFAANIPLASIERKFPQFKGRIPGGIWDEDLQLNKHITNQRQDSVMDLVGPVPSTDGTTVSSPKDFPSGKDGTMDRKQLVTFIEMWHKDEDGNTMVTIMANGVLLRDGVSPFEHNRYPFVRFIDYTIPGMFWGMGEIQQLEKLQDNINQRRAQITDILRLTANPPFIADANSGINPKAMTNRPATIIFKNPGTDVNWLQPPQMPAALFSLQEMDKRDFDAISGVFDVTQGRRPTGIEAASAIAELQEAAQTRIRHKVREMEAGLRQLGRLVVSLVQQFYEEPRAIRIVGAQPGKPQFLEVNQPTIDDEGNEVKEFDLSIGEFDVEIGVGSTLPVNKTRRAEQMIELYQLQVVDRQAVLENVGLPAEEVNRIISRMEAQEQAQLGSADGASGVSPDQADQEAQLLPSEEELAALEQGA